MNDCFVTLKDNEMFRIILKIKLIYFPPSELRSPKIGTDIMVISLQEAHTRLDVRVTAETQEALSIQVEDEEEEEMFGAPQWEEMNTIWREYPTYIAATERNIFYVLICTTCTTRESIYFYLKKSAYWLDRFFEISPIT